jgi:hypothetical protein
MALSYFFKAMLSILKTVEKGCLEWFENRPRRAVYQTEYRSQFLIFALMVNGG